MDIVKVEFAENFKMITDKWNRKTNSWLRYYVLMRLYPREGKAPFSVTMLTYLTSAFWHVRGHANKRGETIGVALLMQSRRAAKSGSHSRRASTLATI